MSPRRRETGSPEPEDGGGVATALADDASGDGAAAPGGGGDGRAGAGGSGEPTPGPFSRLYHGGTHFDFVGRRRIWFAISTVIIVAGLLSLGFRGLNLGIDFKGGTSWEVPVTTIDQAQVTKAVQAAGVPNPTVEVLGSKIGAKTLEVQADLNSLPSAQQQAIKNRVYALMAHYGHDKTVSVTDVGPTWGGEVTKRAVIALVAFLVLVVIYISFRFEPKMALAAFIAMIHDLLVTIGVYTLLGFQVTPDTVIAVLTILGYSLYDTVVVFDRVRDNTKGIGATGRMTYSEMVNLSMNQTLARSINTSLVAILPVLAVLLVGAQLLGATTLQNYGLALFVGLLSGAYSSIFIAAPLLAMMKEREPRYVTIRQRVESRRDRTGLLTPAAAAALVGASAAGGGSRSGGAPRPARSGPIRPGGAARTPAGGRAPAATKTAAKPSGSAAATTAEERAPAASGTAKPTSGAAKRPPPRPRKGGGKGKGKRRR